MRVSSRIVRRRLRDPPPSEILLPGPLGPPWRLPGPRARLRPLQELQPHDMAGSGSPVGFLSPVKQRVKTSKAPRPLSCYYDSPLKGHERWELKIYEGKALCSFLPTSHPPGATEQSPEGNSMPGPPPASTIFRTLSPLPLSVNPSKALCALLGLTSAWVVRGKIYFHNFLWRPFHRRRIVPSEIFTRAVGEARNPPPRNNVTFLQNHWLRERNEEKPLIVSVR